MIFNINSTRGHTGSLLVVTIQTDTSECDDTVMVTNITSVMDEANSQ